MSNLNLKYKPSTSSIICIKFFYNCCHLAWHVKHMHADVIESAAHILSLHINMQYTTWRKC